MSTTIAGYYRGGFGRDSEPNIVSDDMPAFDRTVEERERYETWMCRQLYAGKGFQWDLISMSSETRDDAKKKVREQCRVWGIRYVARQWVIVHTKSRVTREVV